MIFKRALCLGLAFAVAASAPGPAAARVIGRMANPTTPAAPFSAAAPSAGFLPLSSPASFAAPRLDGALPSLTLQIPVSAIAEGPAAEAASFAVSNRSALPSADPAVAHSALPVRPPNARRAPAGAALRSIGRVSESLRAARTLGSGPRPKRPNPT
ncbi:MAG: hypothetical protein CO113_06410 [Elusimicrobia bacterium CG_4_9_14_3_um_filter_62_55]|nr:MAG: hypothetical protein COR54_03420 [Elusimicrobia bacterium CG22_combo_CG10-13_8_21_14_all_63_91]PJA17728.1 MAG: hypothetical protein COX66_03450 [Elusimicrobia bacterium CG_4_10_14_0_2_um_filter_63_34]PJB25905.1 MAG: hypothetical protein CO113_06410 [Elusimicrobia bacterium CG_4_9_14_3_um_filter_62_55]